MRNRINSDLISNIEISDEMKNSIYKNCIKGKRTADFRFKYSGVLSALIIFAVFAVTGIGASAAIIGVKVRLENMDADEYGSYQTEVANDDFVSTDEGFSRELSISEIRRVIELERKYYDENVFPENNMAHYEKADERKENELAYVKEDNMVYLPAGDMDDEQLLEYIDHDAKKRYVNIQELKAEGIEPGQNMALESTVLNEGSKEMEVKKAADKFLKDYYGQAIDDSWVVLVDIFPEEETRYGDVMTLGILHYYRLGTGYATYYDLYMNADDMSLLSVSKSGYGSILDSKQYTKSEAEGLVKECEEKALSEIKENFGYGDPDSITYEFDEFSIEEGKTASVIFEMNYGERTVYSQIRLEDKEVLLLSRF